jgi:uncharacterized membrane protein YdjX (TVP38/TMEM64 family)
MTEHSVVRYRKRKLLILSAALGVFVALAWYVNANLSLEQVVAQENRLREYIAAEPLRAFVMGFIVYTGLALIPGTGGKAIVSGWLFGFWQALVIVSIGLTIGAMAIFSLCRYLIRDIVERRYTSLLEIMNRHLEKEGVFYLLTLRLAHAPYSIVNPVSGASRVGIWTFLWTTAVGLLPANAIWIYVGLRLPSLGELVESGPRAFIDMPLLLALVSCALFPLLVRWLMSRWRPNAVAVIDTHAAIDKT